MIDEGGIQYRWNTVGSKLDERGRRLFAAAEVRTAGWGGLSVVARITGLARSTINRGEDDLDAEPLAKGKIRRSGGGRRAVAETDPELGAHNDIGALFHDMRQGLRMHVATVRYSDIAFGKGGRFSRPPPFSSVNSIKLKRSSGRSKAQ